MISRSFLIICSLALFAVAVSARSVEPVEDVGDYEVDFGSNKEEQDRGLGDWLAGLAAKIGKEAVKSSFEVFQKEFEKMKPECVKTIYKVCDINPVTHPKKFYKCGEAYYKEHKSECRKDKEPKEPKKDEEKDEKKVEEKTEE